MTLNKGDKLRNMDKRRGSVPFPINLPNLHRRSMPVDDRDLRATMPQTGQTDELSNLLRCTSYSPGEQHRGSCASDSSDSVISTSSEAEGQVYKVVLLGEHGVGKSSLARVFGGVEDAGHDCDEAGNTYDRCIVVDEEEASILLYDIWEQDNSQWLKEQCMRMGDAYIIVYSVTDKSSFEKASELRIQLRRARQSENIPIILVGNKSDLVRSREVSVDEGSACAVVFDCKFIETSASLHHNVQDLFEGIVRQIRLRKDSKEENARRMANCRRRESIGKKAKRFLGRMTKHICSIQRRTDSKQRNFTMLVVALTLVMLSTFVPCFGANVKIGVPENYDGIFPWYLAKLHSLPANYSDLVVTGDDEGIFGVDAGFLYALKPLDREKQPSYSLQVSFRTSVHHQSFTVEVCVRDKNDNVPTFIEESMRGSVQLGLLKGIPFMQVEAQDRDDRDTAHAELRFRLMEQTPRIPSSQMFFIDSVTGEVSLTEEGASTLDPEMCGRYKLLAMVKDMAGKANAFFSTGIVTVEVTGNTWASPDPVRLQENLPGPYPIPISQVKWSGSQAEYSLEGEFPEMLFTISREGVIYLNAPLDRETQDQFHISIVVERPDGREIAKPVELRVMVGDANDNRPTFPQAQYHTVVKELAARGTEILTVQAADNDDPKTDNVRIFYRLVGQIPESPRALFRVDRDSGVISVQADSMEGTAPQYTLTITAEDAKGLNSSCTVVVTVQDENNNPPVFSQHEYGPFHIPEDSSVGTTVTAVLARDADVRGGDSWQVNYRLESGNEEEVFTLVADKQTNEVSLVLSKVLDFERESEYILVLSAQNPVALVRGRYGPASTATVSIYVDDVNEGPILSQSHYEVTVREGEEPGRVIATIRGYDPDSHPIRYSLQGDTKKYFSIGKYSGELKTVQALDREENSTYTMEVIAMDGRNSSLTASTLVTVQILDVNDNSPVLVGDYSWKYLCTPRWEDQALVLASRDSDGPQHGGRLNFSLRSDAAVRRNWKLTPINDTHTNLSLNVPYLAPEVYTVPFTISDSSSPPRSTFINLPVTVCPCNVRGNCKMAAKQLQGMPTIQSTVGILLGTFAVIGTILIVVFVRLSYQNPKEPSKTNQERVPLKISL
ncbi:hypothetical protein LDENG_00167540 [Lucifuga dentata]|nr:hypothetical protein LDENG_00167540 [Lucifuga dentata]